MSPATLEAAIVAPAHPALRWRPALYDDGLQHGRSVDQVDATRCGLIGPLTLAETTAGYCPTCYPGRVEVPC